MKFADTTLSSQKKRWGVWTAGFVVAVIAGAGCNNAPEGPTAAEADKVSQQQFDRQIQSIQNDPSKSPEAKQKAIAIIKSQQAASGKTP